MIHTSTNAPSCSIFFHAATLYPIFTTKIISYLTLFGCTVTGIWYSLINSDFEFIPPILAFSFLSLVLVHAFLALYAIQKNNLFFMYFYVLILVLFQLFNCICLISLLATKIVGIFKSDEDIIDSNEDKDLYKIDKYDQSLDTIEVQTNASFLQSFSAQTFIFINFCFIIFEFWHLSVLNHCLKKMKSLAKIKIANFETKEMLV